MGGWIDVACVTVACMYMYVCILHPPSFSNLHVSSPCGSNVMAHFRTPVSNLATTLLRMSRKLPWWALESVHRGSKRKCRLPPFRNSCRDSGGSSCKSGWDVTQWPLAARQLMIWCLVGRREGEEEEGGTSYW